MVTTNTEPTDWRDVADQLTPYQRAILADSEQAWSSDPRPAEWKQSVLLDRALTHIRRTAEDIERFGEIPAPAGIAHLWHWERDDDTDQWQRAFSGPYQKCGGVTVWLYGQQRLDGSARAWVSVDTDQIAELDADTARELGELLALTAEQADRINGDAPPF